MGGLGRRDLPELYRAASRVATEGRHRTTRLVAIPLGAGMGTGFFSLFGGGDGPFWHRAADILTAACFAVAALATGWLGNGTAQNRWTEGRAAAETVKALSWHYVMRADPFTEDRTADEIFAVRLQEVDRRLSRLTGANPATTISGELITPGMRWLRRAPLAAKKRSYHEDRLLDQIDWYGLKVQQAERRVNQLAFWTAVIGALGVGGALARAWFGFSWDAYGIAAIGLASIAAWNEFRQHRPMAAAYRLARHELQLVVGRSLLVGDDEKSWSAFVERSELAIAFEHRMWAIRAR
jgi:hypothetical protein